MCKIEKSDLQIYSIVKPIDVLEHTFGLNIKIIFCLKSLWNILIVVKFILDGYQNPNYLNGLRKSWKGEYCRQPSDKPWHLSDTVNARPS